MIRRYIVFKNFSEVTEKNTCSGVTNYVKFFSKQLYITASVDTLTRNTLVEIFCKYSFLGAKSS